MFGLTANLFASFAATSSTPEVTKSPHKELAIDSISLSQEFEGAAPKQAITSSSPKPKSPIGQFGEFEIHDVWTCISFMHRNNDNLALCNYCCFMLYQIPVAEVEFYLPQLCILLVYQPRHIAMLETFILDQCARSIHFALKTDFLLDAISKSDSSYFMERVENLRYATQLAAIDGVRPKLGENASPIILQLEGGGGMTRKCRSATAMDIGRDYQHGDVGWASDDDSYKFKHRSSFDESGGGGLHWTDEGTNNDHVDYRLCPKEEEAKRSSPSQCAVGEEGWTIDAKDDAESSRAPDETSEVTEAEAVTAEWPILSSRSPPINNSQDDSQDDSQDFLNHHSDSVKCDSLPDIKCAGMRAEDEQESPSCTRWSLDGTEAKRPRVSLDLELMVPYARAGRQSANARPRLDRVSMRLLAEPAQNDHSSDKAQSNLDQTDSFAGDDGCASPTTSSRRRRFGSLMFKSASPTLSLLRLITVTERGMRCVRDLRYKYIWSIKRFVRELSDIGCRLLQAPEETRAKNLRVYLRELNVKLALAGKDPELSIYMPGVYLPFSKSDESHYSIVRIPEHEATILKSRVRAPYMISFETVSLVPPENNGSVFRRRRESSSFFNSRVSSDRWCAAVAKEEGEGVPNNRRGFPRRTPSSSLHSDRFQRYSRRHLMQDHLLHHHLRKCGDVRCGDFLLEILALAYIPLLSPAASPAATSPKSTKVVVPSTSSIPSASSIPSIPSASSIPSAPSAPSTGGGPKLESTDLEALLSMPQNANMLYLRELWSAKERRIRAHSPFGNHAGWRLQSVIVKYGKDCLQEQLSLQLVRQFAEIFKSGHLPLTLVPYKALVLDGNSCLIEPLVNTFSVHQLKKYNNNITLSDYFLKRWGGPHSPEYELARTNFMQSLAAYSLTCYLLQLKDRHNGNILIDDKTGCIIHIDWGYLIFNSPGSMGFESAPFKLTHEYVAVLGGIDSARYKQFKRLFVDGFLELRKHADRIIQLVEIMFMCGNTQKLPCSIGGHQAIKALRQRFLCDSSSEECAYQLENLIALSYDNWRTKRYDNFQWYSNGIFY